MRLKMPWFAIGIAVVLGGIIHIGVVLALPLLAPKNAWGRLSETTPLNALFVLPSASPSAQPMPMMTPDTRVAVCRYDLSNGPIKLITDVLDPSWIVAFNTARGDNYYALQGGDVRRSKIEIIIALDDHVLLEATADRPDEAGDVIVVRSPSALGVATISAPLPSASFASRAETALNAAYCGPHIETRRSEPRAEGEAEAEAEPAEPQE